MMLTCLGFSKLVCTHNSALPPQDVNHNSSVKDAKSANSSTVFIELRIHHLEPSRGPSTQFLTGYVVRIRQTNIQLFSSQAESHHLSLSGEQALSV